MRDVKKLFLLTRKKAIQYQLKNFCLSNYFKNE